MNRRAVFLDRDGTLCEEGPPPTRFDDLRLFRDAVPVVQWLTRQGFAVVVVSNQAAVARGVVTIGQVRAVNRGLAEYFACHGAPFLTVRFCPHHPEGRVPRYSAHCNCRKPAPGMLTAVADEFGIDLADSWMVGDNMTDIQAGWKAGCRSVLVRTGHGQRFESLLPPNVPVVDNLQDFVRLLG